MADWTDELLFSRKYMRSNRMMDVDVRKHYLWLTNDFLEVAHECFEKADELVESHEYMKQRREKVPNIVDSIQELTATTAELARELDAFVPQAENFFRSLGCSCEPYEVCATHEGEPKSEVDMCIRCLDKKTTDILDSLDALLHWLAMGIDKRAAPSRGEGDGEDIY